MVNNNIVKTLVELQKKGIPLYLTDDGYKEFLRLIKESFEAFQKMEMENAV